MRIDKRNELRGRAALEMAQRNGLRVEFFGTHGAIRISGPDVDVIVCDLAVLTAADILPAVDHLHGQHRGRRPGAA